MKSEELALKIRKHAINLTHKTGASHIGAILSVTDIIAVLYSDILNITPQNIHNVDRNRLVLSKGHAGVSVYAALKETGIITEEELYSYYTNGSYLSGHISHHGIKGIEVSTGALGHGFGMACGIALAGKINKLPYHVYAVLGDGECEEGEVWEAAIFANRNMLDNLSVIVDHNKMQAMGMLDEQMSFIGLAEKWRDFGFLVTECDGHNHRDLKKAILENSNNHPSCVIAHTIKGKGISFMENNLLWHYRDPQGEDYDNAIKELEESDYEKSSNKGY